MKDILLSRGFYRPKGKGKGKSSSKGNGKGSGSNNSGQKGVSKKPGKGTGKGKTGVNPTQAVADAKRKDMKKRDLLFRLWSAGSLARRS